MQADFAFSRCTRRCYVSDRGLQPGEAFYSVILSDKDELKRVDIAADAWTSPPEGAVGWWRSKMPPAGAKKLKAAPDSILLDTLTQLLEQPESDALAYLLALLLVRRRVLTEDQAFDCQVTDEPQDCWHLQHPGDGRQWTVPVAMPSADKVECVQQELTKLLFTEE